MFYVTVWGKAAESWASDEVLDNLYALSDSSVLLGELLELLRYRYEQIDFIDEPVDLGFDCPLDLHCTYTLSLIHILETRKGVALSYAPTQIAI